VKKYFQIFLFPFVALATSSYDLKAVKLDVVESNNFQTVTANWEEGFTNRFDIYWSTNEVDWQVAGYNICPLDFESNTVKWIARTRVEKAFFNAMDISIDHDEDGIPDCREAALFKTNPAKTDTDGDDVPDMQELRQRTDPVHTQDMLDSDCDMIPDEEERKGFILPIEGKYTSEQASENAALRGGRVLPLDEDVLKELPQRFFMTRNTKKTDLFWVKIGEAYEVLELPTLARMKKPPNKASGYLLEIFGLNPNSEDTDGDGLSDTLELVWGGNPLLRDTDSDGIFDYEETERNLPLDDPENPVYRLPPDIGGGKLTNPYYREERERRYALEKESNKKSRGIKPPEDKPTHEYDGKFRRSQILRTPDSFQKITYRVSDLETGLPVTNAVMKVWRGDGISVMPNGSLEFINKNPKTGRGLNRSFSAPGYYLTRTKHVFEKTDWITGKQMPWNPTQEVPLRRIKDPVEMVSFRSPHGMKIPVINAPVEFDAVLGDWLPPHGKGETVDFTFHLLDNTSRDPLVRTRLYLYGFQNGIQKYYPDEKVKTSEFVFPYLASVNGYKRFLEKSETVGVNPSTDNFDSNANYIFRIRATNHLGFVTGFYGRFDGEVIMTAHGGLKFNYMLNTNRISRSLENMLD